MNGTDKEVRALRKTALMHGSVQDLTLRHVDLEPILGLGRVPPTRVYDATGGKLSQGENQPSEGHLPFKEVS